MQPLCDQPGSVADGIHVRLLDAPTTGTRTKTKPHGNGCKGAKGKGSARGGAEGKRVRFARPRAQRCDERRYAGVHGRVCERAVITSTLSSKKNVLSAAAAAA